MACSDAPADLSSYGATGLRAVFACICRVQRSVEAARLSISLTVRAVTGRRPRCLPRASVAFMLTAMSRKVGPSV